MCNCANGQKINKKFKTSQKETLRHHFCCIGKVRKAILYTHTQRKKATKWYTGNVNDYLWCGRI